jgi:TonB family protein
MKTTLIVSYLLFVSTAFAQDTLPAKNAGSTGEGIAFSGNLNPDNPHRGLGSVIGTVIDQSSRGPIVNAKVTLLGTKFSAYTSEAGQYEIDSIAEGIYQMKAEAGGYEPRILNNVSFDRGKRATGFFTLQKAEQEPPDFVEVEEQPQPVNTPAPVYPDAARKDGLEGTVWVKLWVDANGTTRKASILKSDAEIFNQPTIDAAMKWKFTPAVMKGKPVAVWVSVPFKFKMNISGTNQPKAK